jgi:hypothetical protein
VDCTAPRAVVALTTMRRIAECAKRNRCHGYGVALTMTAMHPECRNSDSSGYFVVADVLLRQEPDEEEDEEEDEGNSSQDDEDDEDGAGNDDGYSE